jgi:glycosyltransferase involved in cell wall biosynthesis
MPNFGTMKVLVFSHRLEIGGTQTNAVELAAAVRDRAGMDVVLFAAPGPSLELARRRDVRVIEAPDADHHPSPTRMRALARVVRDEQPDLMHVWDWPQCFDAYYVEHMIKGLPVLCTVMGMVVPSFLPRALPATFGTPQLHARALRQRRGRVDLLEPPVDIDYNAPEAVDPTAFKAEFGLDDGRLNVVVISRLVAWLKLESLLQTVAAIEALAATGRPVRLVIVGEGPSADQLAQLARQVNERTRPGTIVLTGSLIDPRPAYAAADIMVGMGGSALRSLAFAKPLVVLGEHNFSEVFDHDSSHRFIWQGYYGLGDGRPSDRLRSQIEGLVDSADRRASLGKFGRDLVVDRYALGPAADRLAALYREVAAMPRPVVRRVFEGGRTAAYLSGRALRLGELKRSMSNRVRRPA